MENFHQDIKKIHTRLDKLEEKIDMILDILQGDMKTNSTKMGEHIDFVENVYENVKHPLGYLCNKIKSIAGNSISNKNNLIDNKKT